MSEEEKLKPVYTTEESASKESEELERIRAKMNQPPMIMNDIIIPQGGGKDLPSMEASAKTDEENKADVDMLKKKADNGAASVVSKIMKQPEVQHVIRVEINKQMFISGLFMAFFLVGFFQIFNVAKVVFAYNWTVDLVLGILLILIGGAYTVRQIRQK